MRRTYAPERTPRSTRTLFWPPSVHRSGSTASASVGIGAPVVEEIFYRGLLQRSLERRFGVWPGILGSALLFGVSHFQLLQLPALVLFGVVLGLLAQRTGRLAAPIAAHIVFNMTTVLFLVGS